MKMGNCKTCGGWGEYTMCLKTGDVDVACEDCDGITPERQLERNITIYAKELFRMVQEFTYTDVVSMGMEDKARSLIEKIERKPN